MRISAILLIIISLPFITPSIAASKKGTVNGGQMYEIPDWFKVSFLDMHEDASEAKANKKGVILFMHLDGCPYCSRVLKENFRQGKNKEYIQKNFDVIAINIRGGREITWADGHTYTEKELSSKLKVHFTPTIVFLDEKAATIMQINGYRKPRTFRHAMEYIRSKEYIKLTLAQYIQKQSPAASYQFIPNARFSKVGFFSGYKKPLAIMFEDNTCEGCQEFHKKVLQHKQVQKELDKFLLVRLDAHSDHPLIDLDGKKTTARKWAYDLSLSYRPGIILFDEGKEQSRIDGRLYHFHFKEALRYVSDKFYKQYSNYNAYLAVRQEQLLKQGINIDLAE